MPDRRKRSGFEARWIALGVALGAGAGVYFGSIPVGAGLGAIGGLAVALLRAARGWRTGHEIYDDAKPGRGHDRQHPHHHQRR
ncbi:MAG TPA: hypothetical protein PKC43_05485 [Phycisphaerales bacterium]|mgnify:CR=1 FL=1|nr:hypothetical protein [Phycisphaerales bacterium]HMP36883.1 hypothetical protein [Phycisphaerales bacterium]